MKIAIIGTRGIPAKYGGFETFAEEVSKRLVEMGIEVTVVCPHADEMPLSFGNVNLLYTKTTKDKNAIKYYIESVKIAVKENFDVILMCGQGGYAYIPYFIRYKKNLPVFITNTDGIEHRRTKWNIFVRLLVVRILGEWSSIIFSHEIVADSKGIQDYIKKQYKWIPNKNIHVIEYGADVIDERQYPESLISEFGLTNDNYHLVVSRLEPENNVAMIIDGYRLANTEKELVVVGNLKETNYVKNLQKSGKGKKVKFLGGIYEPEKLKALRIHASSYLHGHSVGGTNPSLLEALGAGNIIIGHDNPFIREVTDNKMFYFSNPKECAFALDIVENLTSSEKNNLKEFAKDRIKSYYNWDRISTEYASLFKSCLQKKTIK